MNKKSNIESIIISKDNYYEDFEKKGETTSIVINRTGQESDNIHFRTYEEIEKFRNILTEYLNQNYPRN